MPLNQRLRLPQPVTRHRSLTPPAHDRSDLVYLMDVKHRRRRKRSQPRAALAAVTPNRGVLDATAREVGVRIVGGDHAAQGVAVQGVQLDGRFLLLYCQSETGRVLEVQVETQGGRSHGVAVRIRRERHLRVPRTEVRTGSQSRSQRRRTRS